MSNYDFSEFIKNNSYFSLQFQLLKREHLWLNIELWFDCCFVAKILIKSIVDNV